MFLPSNFTMASNQALFNSMQNWVLSCLIRSVILQNYAGSPHSIGGLILGYLLKKSIMTSNSVRIRGLPLKINDYEYLGIAQEGIQQKPAHQRRCR